MSYRNPTPRPAGRRNGIGFFGLLFIVLLVLKLTGLAALSWWWVFAPLLAGFGFFIVGVVILAAAAVADSR